MKKILVTGAPGYVGAHLIKKLAESGHTIDGLDNNWNQNNIDKYLRNKIIHDIKIPINNFDKNYDVIFHLAAKTKVSDSVKDPELFYNTNIIGTANVLKNIEHNHFIHASTGAAFIPESSPYALSKRASEDLVKCLKSFTICRFYNISGNDGFNKFDDGYYHLIRVAAAAANKVVDKVTIHGIDYDTPDGTTIRNYTHIKDIIDSLLKILESGPSNAIECLGNKTGYSVLEVLNTMKKVTGIDFKIAIGDRRLGDSVKSMITRQSDFFQQNYTLEEICLSAFKVEIGEVKA